MGSGPLRSIPAHPWPDKIRPRHHPCGTGPAEPVRDPVKRVLEMMILADWLERKMEEARAAFRAGTPAALAMALGELHGALVARDGNSDEVVTAIGRLADAEKAAMRGQLAAAREGFEEAAVCIRALIREGLAEHPTAAA
jgi:hypothetical protein